MTRTVAVLTVLFTVWTAAVPTSAQEPSDLDGLLAAFRDLPGLEARFREEKRIALLAAPLVNEGTIHFAPPNLLARHVTSPERSSLVIRGETLTMGAAGESERVNLRESPVVRSFVRSFLDLLSGDREALEETWRVGFEREGDAWTVTLRPRGEPLDGIVERIRFRGRGVVLERMTLRETNGDVTETTFSAVQTDRSYSDRQRSRVFRIGGE